MIRHLGRGFLLLAAFTAAFALAAWGLQALYPWRDEENTFALKLQALSEHPATFNLLFVGSSRVNHQIDPAIFDRTAAEHGRPVHSYNLGVDGTFAPEDLHNCELIYRQAPRWDWVFLEASIYFPIMLNGIEDSRRFVAWHDTPRFLSVLRFLVPPAKSAKGWRKQWAARQRQFAAMRKNWGQFEAHTRAYGKHLLNVGQGAEFLRTRLYLAPADKLAAASVQSHFKRAGYVPVASPPDTANLALYAKALLERKTNPAQRVASPPEARQNLARMLALFQKEGARIVVFDAPTAEAIIFDPTEGLGVPFLDFCQPEAYPDLFLLENRHDRGHLNEPGARIFSRLLAEEWVKQVP